MIGRRLTATGLIALLAASGGAADLAVDGRRLVIDGQPRLARLLLWPLAARRDGVAFDAATAIDEARLLGCTGIWATATPGPMLRDVVALVAEGRRSGLPILLEPLPRGDRAAAEAVARAVGSPDGWAAAGDAAQYLAGLAPARPVIDDQTPPVLLEPGIGYGDWSGMLRRDGEPLVARVACAPPDWLIARQALRPAAEQADLYATAALRPQSVHANAGEYLLVPTPAALRLAAYAALGAGARGLVFDHVGHLCGGEDPYCGTDRAATVERLCGEVAALEPWLAQAERLEPPTVPAGIAASLLGTGADRLLLLWRQRPLDGRVPAGSLRGEFDVIVPWTGATPVIRRLAGDGFVSVPADPRPEGLRLVVPAMDLTAAWLITSEPPAPAAEALAGRLPRTAELAVVTARRRWAKVNATLSRLEAGGIVTGGRPLLARSASQLQAAVEALTYGYHRSAIEQADEAERLLRQAEALAYETIAAEPPERAGPDALATFATLPYVLEARRPEPAGPHAVTAEEPLRLDFEELEPGSIPRRWHALEGFDQSVATLRIVGADGRHLRWLPLGGEPGALYLPFTALTGPVLSLRLRAEPGGERLIALAAASGSRPTAGVLLRADGTVSAWPQAGATAPLPRVWTTLALAAADGQARLRLGEVDLTPDGGAAVGGAGFGALALVSFGGDAGAVEIDDLEIRAR